MPLPETPFLSRRNLLRGGVGLAGLVGAGPLLAACSGDGSSDGVAADGTVTITMWHGQADQGKATLDKLVADFQAKNPKIKVNASSGGVLADSMLQKITTALSSGQYPDIAYIFGPDIASVARSPKVAHLGAYTKKPELRWDDFYPAARDAVTVDGRAAWLPGPGRQPLRGLQQEGVQGRRGARARRPGGPGTTSSATARQLTDPAKGIFGTGWPADGGEDCVWRIYPMIWDLGGDIVTKDGRQVAFDDDSGLKALETINQLGKDKSVYPDTKPGSETMYQIFNNNKMGMVPTGPWQLPDFIENKTEYGVVPAAHVHRQRRDHRRARHLDGLRQRLRPGRCRRQVPDLPDRGGPGRPVGQPGREPAAAQQHGAVAGVEAARRPRPSVSTSSPRR